MKKIILPILTGLILTGCANNYQLVNNSFAKLTLYTKNCVVDGIKLPARVCGDIIPFDRKKYFFSVAVLKDDSFRYVLFGNKLVYYTEALAEKVKERLFYKIKAYLLKRKIKVSDNVIYHFLNIYLTIETYNLDGKVYAIGKISKRFVDRFFSENKNLII